MELDGAANLPPVCVRTKPHRKDASVYVEWSRNMGTAAAARLESRDCHSSVRMRSARIVGARHIYPESRRAVPVQRKRKPRRQPSPTVKEKVEK